MDNSQVQATDVTYTFTMTLSTDPTGAGSKGKLMVRFPEDYETPFAQDLDCQAIQNFNKSGKLECEYMEDVRMLKVTNGFPL